MSIEIKKLEHTYNENTPFSHAALKGIDLSIPEGKVTAIIGQTGSGKSTFGSTFKWFVDSNSGYFGYLWLPYSAFVENQRCEAIEKRSWTCIPVS